MTPKDHPIHTRASLSDDLRSLGVGTGDVVMVHAAMSRLGRLLNGPDAFIAALRDTVGAAGTVMAYTDWDGSYDDLLDASGRVPDVWRDHVPAFDSAASRANRDNGILPEFLRTTPGALRSGNPGASVAAIGRQADRLTRDHPLAYGYGDGSPFARLVGLGGRVLMAGAPLDTMTLLHHAEHLARLPGKRIRRYEAPLQTPDGIVWHMIEEFDTFDPVVEGFADDFFGEIVRDYLASGKGTEGRIGAAPSVLVDAADICRFAVAWMEDRAGG